MGIDRIVTAIIDTHRDCRAIAGHRLWNCLTPWQSSRASGRPRPKPPLSMAAIFPPTDLAPSAPVTCRGRQQLGAVAHTSQDQDQGLLGRACAFVRLHRTGAWFDGLGECSDASVPLLPMRGPRLKPLKQTVVRHDHNSRLLKDLISKLIEPIGHLAPSPYHYPTPDIINFLQAKSIA